MAADIVHIDTLRERRHGRRVQTPVDASRAVDAAWQMLEAGEVKPREFLELCWEALPR